MNSASPLCRASVCLLRYHDGSAKPNWGGRATSLALAGLIDRSERFSLGSVVNGVRITAGIPELERLAPAPNLAVRGMQRLGITLRGAMARATGLAATADHFSRVEELASHLLRVPAPGTALCELRNAMEKADEIWMNGEGDFTLTPHTTLLRTLVFMQMGIELAKPVRLVNSMLSAAGTRGTDSATTGAVGRVLARCASISYRDPESLDLHRAFYSGLSAAWTPDALFAWAGIATKIVQMDVTESRFGPAMEVLPPALQHMLLSKEPFVAISGSSFAKQGGKNRSQGELMLHGLIEGLRKAGLSAVVMPTCSGDDWMLDVGEAAQCLTTPARLPLASGLLLLSRAACFVSGRYHPSIMASLVGTPLVLMKSNSHKTRSLQSVLGISQPVELPFLTQMTEAQSLVDATVSAVARGAELRATLGPRMNRLAEAAGRIIPPASPEHLRA